MSDLPGDDAEKITFVGPVAAQARLAELGALPGMAARVAAIRAEMAATDRVVAEEQEHPGKDAG